MITQFVLTRDTPTEPGVDVGLTYATGLDAFDYITAIITSVGGAGGTINIVLQVSHDGGTTWRDWFRSDDITDGASAETIVVSPHSGDGTPVVVGMGETPALAKGTVAPGSWGSKMRCTIDAGDGVDTAVEQVVIIEGYRATG